MREEVEVLEHHAHLAADLLDVLQVAGELGALDDDLPALVLDVLQQLTLRKEIAPLLSDLEIARKAELKDIRDRVDDRIRGKKEDANPFFVDFDDDDDATIVITTHSPGLGDEPVEDDATIVINRPTGD